MCGFYLHLKLKNLLQKLKKLVVIVAVSGFPPVPSFSFGGVPPVPSVPLGEKEDFGSSVLDFKAQERDMRVLPSPGIKEPVAKAQKVGGDCAVSGFPPVPSFFIWWSPTSSECPIR